MKLREYFCVKFCNSFGWELSKVVVVPVSATRSVGALVGCDFFFFFVRLVSMISFLGGWVNVIRDSCLWMANIFFGFQDCCRWAANKLFFFYHPTEEVRLVRMIFSFLGERVNEIHDSCLWMVNIWWTFLLSPNGGSLAGMRDFLFPLANGWTRFAILVCGWRTYSSVFGTVVGGRRKNSFSSIIQWRRASPSLFVWWTHFLMFCWFPSEVRILLESFHRVFVGGCSLVFSWLLHSHKSFRDFRDFSFWLLTLDVHHLSKSCASYLEAIQLTSTVV